MVDGGDGVSSEKTVDVARSIVIAKLSNAMYDEPPESFNNIIYALLEKAFNMPKETVERIIKYPHLELEPGEKEFACKCLISFRSRVHKHRVIAQKAKLEAPTTVETITQIPKEILELEDELEVADEYAGDEEELINSEETSALKASQCVNERKSETDPFPENAVVNLSKKEIKIEAESDTSATVTCATGALEDIKVTDTCASGCALKPTESSKFVEYDEDDSASPEEGNTENKKDDSVKAGSFLVSGNNALISRVESTAVKDVSDPKQVVNHIQEKGERGEVDVGTISALKKDLSPVCKIDNHKEHFKTLAISWDGAPEFQWRTVHNSSDRRTLIIENFFYSDLANVWLYPAVVRASDIRLTFDRQGPDAKDATGKMELKFVDETVVSSCAINYLVHIRTSRGRRLKIFLPQTKTAVRLKSDLEERLGRIREPSELMHQLIVKPVEESITGDDIRSIAFCGYQIKNVEFKVDALGQRCAIVTFENASAAVAAHLANEFVHFGDAEGPKGWHKVFYPYAMMRHSGAGGLLTKSEYKKFTELEDKKSSKERESLLSTTVKPNGETTPPKLTKVKDEIEDENECSGEPHNQVLDSLSAKEQREPVKQKSQKRSFQYQNRGPSTKKMRRSMFGIRKGPQPTEAVRRPASSMPQGNKNRRSTRGKRGGKRQQRGGVMNGQGGVNDWRTIGGAAVNSVGLNHDIVQPTPLLTREDYEALQSCVPMKSHSSRTFPKKGKQRNIGKPTLSRPLTGFSRLESSSQLHPSRFPRLDREEDGFLMDGMYYEQRDPQFMGSERGLRRRPEDLDYRSFGPHDGVGYGNPSSSVYFNRTPGNYINDGYERDLEGINDYSRMRPYDMDPLCENRWNTFDDYPRGGYGGRRNTEYNSYDRSLQGEVLPYGSAWR